MRRSLTNSKAAGHEMHWSNALSTPCEPSLSLGDTMSLEALAAQVLLLT
jgi:hypothetical protein